MKNTADDHWKLALWCEQNGLTPEAEAHLVAVTRLDPGRDAAWKRLGLKKVAGRWVNDLTLAAERKEGELQKAADRTWGKKLADIASDLGKPSRRAEAEVRLGQIDDPRAIPSLFRTFGRGPHADESRLLQILSQIDAPAASRGLAHLAVHGANSETRRAATEVLRHRDPREFLLQIVAQFRKPIRYQVVPAGANGTSTPGLIAIDKGNVIQVQIYTQDYTGLFPANVQRAFPADVPIGGPPLLYAQNWANAATSGQGTVLTQQDVARIASNPSAIPGVIAAAAASPQSQANQQLLTNMFWASYEVSRVIDNSLMRDAAQRNEQANVIASIDTWNNSVTSTNANTRDALTNLSGLSLGEDTEAWRSWAADRMGYTYEPTTQQSQPVEVELVPLHYSCFAADTPVQTADGPRPIQTLHVGDQVLTQDARAGRLAFEPIVAVAHNRPNETLRIEFGGDTIVATPIHRFWKAGYGWVMARDLKPGDAIRRIGGIATVKTISPDATQPVFNLEVARGKSFFVGKSGVLVHDNSMSERIEYPFDALASTPRD